MATCSVQNLVTSFLATRLRELLTSYATVEDEAIADGMLFRRQNRVHNTYEAQTEFLQKFGHGNSGSEPAPAQTEATAAEGSTPKPAWTIDASQDRYYYWTIVVSVAFVYNLLFVIARQVFSDLIGPTGVPVCMQTTSLYANTTKECTDDQLMNMLDFFPYA
ncbi:hypothetical protein ANCDUO_08886 [Ancylostoma duodenale]|uniref:Uncharacterized protein n=1 Tax=Ancylostoma duodenale TaxID=51022 RepID=A0A0C2GUQ2_9BILA|nr:hypothetical protein ANCDUO_08886 [Ancylostoma duodenale]